MMGDRPKAAESRAQALALFREAGDREGEAATLFGEAIALAFTDIERARASAEASLRIRRELGQKKKIAELLMYLESLIRETALDAERVELLEEARAVCGDIGVDIWEASCLDLLAEIAEKRGERSRAEALRAESLRVYAPSPEEVEMRRRLMELPEEKDGSELLSAIESMFGKNQ
jgi:hypothetical protein